MLNGEMVVIGGTLPWNGSIVSSSVSQNDSDVGRGFIAIIASTKINKCRIFFAPVSINCTKKVK